MWVRLGAISVGLLLCVDLCGETLFHPLGPFPTSLKNYEFEAALELTNLKRPWLKEERSVLSLNTAKRVTERVELFLNVPLERSLRKEIAADETLFLGDVQLGARWTLIRNLFQYEWFPTITLITGIFLPTGTTDQVLSSGNLSSGTGAGHFRTLLGVALSKQVKRWGYSIEGKWHVKPNRLVKAPIAWKRLEQGATINISVSGRLTARPFTVAFGLDQAFSQMPTIDNVNLETESPRRLQAFLKPSFEVAGQWLIQFGIETSLNFAPFTTEGQNFTALSFHTKYAFY